MDRDALPDPPSPSHRTKPPVAPCFAALGEVQLKALERSLRDNYYAERSYIRGEALESDLRAHMLDRYRFTCNRWVPWISRFVTVPGAKVVEIGSGTGAITCAFGRVAAEVHGFDIDAGSTEAARDRARILGLENTHHHYDLPERIAQGVAAVAPGDADVVSLYATLEHQTYEERQGSLRMAWDALRPGGVLVVGQTPNQLTYFHPHTSRMPFFDMLPDWVKFRYADRLPPSMFRDELRALGEVADAERAALLDRWGRGVSFHEFELALGDLEPIVVGQGFEPEILSFNPVEFEEKLLLSWILETGMKVPIGFARRWLTLVLHKPGPGVVRPPPQFDPVWRQSPYRKDA
jgi:S-adenosylmethionine-dependent methyltransferase